MKPLDAKLVHNIATDFETNGLKSVVEENMNVIWQRAQHGELDAHLLFPTNASQHIKDCLVNFWTELNYNVEVGSTAYTVKW